LFAHFRITDANAANGEQQNCSSAIPVIETPAGPSQWALGPSECQILLGPYIKPNDGWLNDVIINAAQSLLHERYPLDAGLRDTILVNAGHIKLDSANVPFVQIVFDPVHEHWIVVTNRGCSDNTLRIYCSLMYKPSSKCLLVISQYANFNAVKLTIQLMNVAKQRNREDCGLYAVGYAEQLLSGLDPSSAVFRNEAMRQHLYNCIINKSITAFPVSQFRVVRNRKEVESQFDVDVHCSCRGVSFGFMVMCDNCDTWYHSDCLKWSAETVTTYRKQKSKKFICSMCAMDSGQ
jgi:hypothetical protein